MGSRPSISCQPGKGPAVERLGEKIRRFRQERGLSQDRLAIESRIDQSGLSKYERGKGRTMSETAIRRVADVLKVSFEELVTGTDFGS